MLEITYNPEIIELIKSLTTINNNVVIEPYGTNKIVIKRQDVSKTNRYILICDKKYFDISNQIIFTEFSDFYAYYKCFKSPKLYVDENVVYITDGSDTKLEYRQSDPRALQKYGECNIPEGFKSDIEFTLSKTDIDTLRKMIHLLKSEYINFNGNENELYVKLITKSVTNKFSKRFDFKNSSGFTNNFDFSIISNSLDIYLPSKQDYQVGINTKGIIKFHMINDDFSFDFYTTRVSQGT